MPDAPDSQLYGTVYGTYAVTLDLVIRKTQRVKRHEPELSAFHSTVHAAWTGHSFTRTEDVDAALRQYGVADTTAKTEALEELGRVIVTLQHYVTLLLPHKKAYRRGRGKKLMDYVEKIHAFSRETLCTEAFAVENARHV